MLQKLKAKAKTKNTIEQINETRSWFFEKKSIKLMNLQPDLPRKKKRERTQTESQMREEKSPPPPQKYKQF